MSSTSLTGKVKATLKSALSNNSRAVADAQNGYDQSVLNVCNGMSSIIASELPVLNSLPANWDEISKAYINAKTDALGWTNQVYAKLQSTPKSVQNYNNEISKTLANALKQATKLINDPGNATAKELLKDDLENIQDIFDLVNTYITGALNSINYFGVTTLPGAVAQLNTLVDDAYKDAKIDQGKIDDLKQQIADLNEEIFELAVSLGISSAAVAAELAVGIMLLELGPADAIIIGIAVVATGAAIALDAVTLVEDQNKVKVLNTQLNSLEQDAAALQIMGDSYKALAASTTALSADVENIQSAWQAVEDEMTAAINEINKAIDEEDATPVDYQALYDDIAAAQTEWNEVYANCSLLYINVLGNPAQLSIGMSSDQVSAELDTCPTIDFVTYINNYSSPVAA